MSKLLKSTKMKGKRERSKLNVTSHVVAEQGSTVTEAGGREVDSDGRD